MLERLESSLKDSCYPSGGAIVAGVSGGPDSLVLLHALMRLGLPVIAAHLDHGLRPTSRAEAESVRQMAHQLAVPAVIARQEVAALAQAAGQSIEEAARNVRYRFLFDVAAEHGAAAVAVGHNADDQVETVLMHLLRGAGLEGLRGMAPCIRPNPWSATLPLLRPLLSVWRSEIEAYAAEQGLRPLTDESNTDLRFYRNRLRHAALPYLETLNPGVRQRLWHTAALLRDDEAVVAAAAAAAWEACCLERGPGYVALHAARLRLQPVALQRRVFRQAIAHLRPGLRDIDFAAVQRALAFLAAPAPRGPADLIAGLVLEAESERLWLAEPQAARPAPAWPQLPPEGTWPLAVPGALELPGGGRLIAAVHPVTPDAYTQATANPDPYQAWLAADALRSPLTVRTRRPGDRFRPLGLGGHSLKLSDFMINTGLPRRARRGWPLVLSGDEIAWVPGYRLAEPFAVQPGTRRLVRLTYTPPEG
jgi:tRNA(Ile)-lysidine synthase